MVSHDALDYGDVTLACEGESLVNNKDTTWQLKVGWTEQQELPPGWQVSSNQGWI